MNGGTAYHLKQIMTNEHLNVAQAAKEIGISPTSMRKVLKDAQLSQPIMFKINRYIDAHRDNTATPNIHTASVKPAYTITQTNGHKPEPQAEKVAKEEAAQATKRNNQQAERQVTKQAQPTQPTTQQNGKAQQARQQTRTTKRSAAKPANQQQAKAPTKQQTTRQTRNQANQAGHQKQQPKAQQKQQANRATQAQPKAKAKQQSTAKPKQTAKQQPTKAQQSAQQKATRAKQTPQTKATRAKQTAQTKATRQATNQLAKATQSTDPADQKQPTARAERQTAKRTTASKTKQPQTDKAQPKAPTTSKPARDTAKRPVGDLSPRVTRAASKQAHEAATTVDAAPKTQVNPASQTATTATPSGQTASTVTSESTAYSAAFAETPAAFAANQPQATTTTATTTEAHAKSVESTLQLFIDESFVHGNDYQRNMYIGVTVADPDDEHALDQFSKTLYPFGWQPGDEVKARGKDHDAVTTMLKQASATAVQNFVVYSPLSDAGNFAMGFGVLYPYLATILRVLETYPNVPDKVRIALDKRNEIESEQLGIAARILNSYIKSATGKNVIFLLRTVDSKDTLGVQYSDFIAHSALTFTADELAQCGITRLADVGSQLGDELTMYSMIGLQKYLLDDHTVTTATHEYQSPILVAGDRLFRQASKAVDYNNVPGEALTQAKLVMNQLLQVAPSSVSGAINNMPFQTWYDIVARAAALLHYTDQTLPKFDIDPDALQIAKDALNTVANLLASAK